ncbi:Protocatechuate 3,4-dioxygenase alpha chain [Mycolicibacterium chubuense]|uniref:Protocatechuate 3,4-dioxygenase alpha chain n=2 Tax=Mycolicibacterium chubuense TaxID=1800 RepID=A0A0J6WQY9_MYCCU|nr:Protocatechuate 3,4-dioxygenase alpha chain [Mycolicibacterium chubuense]SPY00503.1 protocatechuate 3,4-dioxygenase subunit alpha [Mycolicibacterium chubuense]
MSKGQSMSTLLTPTPGQTIGPFYGYALPFEHDSELVPPQTPGAIRFHGTVTDGDGKPVPDALLEIWQAGADGSVPRQAGSLHRDGWTFTGWGRASTDDAGHFSFSTVEPGATAPGRAAFILVTVFGRGLLNRLFTRAYVPGPALDTDPLLGSLPADRRRTLIAEHDATGLRFDISLQGPDETVFLRYPGH